MGGSCDAICELEGSACCRVIRQTRKQLLMDAAATLKKEANRATKRLEESEYPGSLGDIVVGYQSALKGWWRKRVVGYVQQTTEHTTWSFFADNIRLHLCDDGELYVYVMSRFQAVNGEWLSGLHRVDSSSIHRLNIDDPFDASNEVIKLRVTLITDELRRLGT